MKNLLFKKCSNDDRFNVMINSIVGFFFIINFYYLLFILLLLMYPCHIHYLTNIFELDHDIWILHVIPNVSTF